VAGRRSVLVFLHVVTSVGWMSQALALFALVSYGWHAPTVDVRHSAYAMAEVLDSHVLLYLANASAYTGLMLAALTVWGYFRYWWVLVKFAITVSQLYLGIFLLSPALAAAAQGNPSPVGRLVAGSLLMVAAIGFQAWVSVAKPWRRTPWSSKDRPARTPDGLFLAAVAVPVVDYLAGTLLLGVPMPALQLLTAIGYPVYRRSRKPRTSAVAG
jgi:hypothetical protein